MTLPATIRTSVSQSAITKVTRLFNGSIADVLNELLQNARRAGARRVDIETLDLAGHPTLSVRDDGRGIDDPAVLVTLGQSGWDADTARREDPAGMGVFSLAGRRIEIRSFSASAGQGWRIIIPADAWETSTALAVEPFPIDAGTEILIDLPETWENMLDAQVRINACSYPITVFLRGEEIDRSDFLTGAAYVETVSGVRIGVFCDTMFHGNHGSQFNFHGIRVACDLPSKREIDQPFTWRTRIDIVDAPQLQLVLPARKELVQNQALTAIREAAERAIFRAIRAVGAHRLSFREWQRASTLGIDLPEAEAGLEPWSPTPVHGRERADTLVSIPAMVRMQPLGPHLEHCAARAFASNIGVIDGALVRSDDSFAGYAWYDRLPRISDLRFVIEHETQFHQIGGDDEPLPDTVESGPVDSIVLDFAIGAGDRSDPQSERISIPADVVIDLQDHYCGVEDVILLWARSATIDPDDAADLLENACFCFDEDRGGDSYDTQLREFRAEARHLATSLLLSEEAAALQRIRTTLQDELCWLIPEGRTLSVTASRTEITLALDLPSRRAS